MLEGRLYLVILIEGSLPTRKRLANNTVLRYEKAMNEPDVYPLYRAQLRLAMKNQGVSHAEMGRRIGLSESGVKKIFAAPDISLSRLAQICAALDLSLAELISTGTDSIPTPLKLSPEAEACFIKDRATFYLFFLLLTEPKPFRDILCEQGISQDEAHRSLRQLEKLQLIERNPGDRIVLRVHPAHFKVGSPLINRLVREWSLDLVNETLPLDGQQQLGDVKIIRLLYLLPQSQRELQAALEEVARDFTARSFLERKVYGKKTAPFRLVALSRKGHFVNFR